MSVCFILQVRLKAGHEEEFLRRYDALRERVAAGLDGHVVHQLCQGLDEPDLWLILSEWETLEASQEWERSQEHRELTMPLRECWTEAQRTSYAVRLETKRRLPDTETAPTA
jgi:heme-degrading monooxygenase HmoA